MMTKRSSLVLVFHILIVHLSCPTVFSVKNGKQFQPTTIIPCNATKLVYSDESVIVQSPGFGLIWGYKTDVNCQWQIESSNNCDLMMNCPKFRLNDLICLDYMEIQDGYGWTRRHCGINSPKELKLDRKTKITFKTNSLPKFPWTGFRCRIDCEPKGMTKKLSTSTSQPAPTKSTKICQCGRGRRVRKPRLVLVNGTAVFTNEFPFMAALVDKNGRIFCGASILSDQWILTASHCVIDFSTTRETSSFDVLLNYQDRHSRMKRKVERLSISEIVLHPNYNPIRLDYDAALLKLTNKLYLTDSTLVPVCLPKPESNDLWRRHVGENVTVCGFGGQKTFEEHEPLKIEKVDVTVMMNRHCSKIYPNRKIKPEKICAYSPFQDSCQGDSGSPMLSTLVKGKIPHYTQIGIVSSGYAGKPGIYIQTSKILPWIMKTIEDSNFCSDNLEIRA